MSIQIVKFLAVVTVSGLALTAWTGGALANPLKDESGKGRGKSEFSREFKAEDRSGGKVERKRGKNDDKDEVTRKGGPIRTVGHPGAGAPGTVGRPQVRTVGCPECGSAGQGGLGSGRPDRPRARTVGDPDAGAGGTIGRPRLQTVGYPGYGYGGGGYGSGRPGGR